MTTDTTYNGWANYATWRVNLEVFDGQSAADFDIQHQDDYAAGQALKEYVEETIELSTTYGIARDYAYAFIADVNWREIAQHMLDDYNED